VLGLLGVAPAQSMHGRNLASPAREEARSARYSAGRGDFSQHVDIIQQDGRRFILGGGH
jgi:phosphonoacetate hydrolase